MDKTIQKTKQHNTAVEIVPKFKKRVVEDIVNTCNDYINNFTSDKAELALEELKKVSLELDGKKRKKNSIFSWFASKYEDIKIDYQKTTDIVKNLDLKLEQEVINLEKDIVTFQVLQRSLEEHIIQRKDYAKQLKAKKANNTNDEFVQKRSLYDNNQAIIASEQARVTLEAICRNNKEIILNITRVRENTLQVLCNQLLADSILKKQELILNATRAITESTNGLLKDTAKELANKTIAIQKEATSGILDDDTLRDSLKQCYFALDEIKNFKKDSIPKIESKIKETVSILNIIPKEVKYVCSEVK